MGCLSVMGVVLFFVLFCFALLWWGSKCSVVCSLCFTGYEKAPICGLRIGAFVLICLLFGDVFLHF